MNTDTERRHDDGRKVYVVGPVERWVVGIGATIIGVVAMNYGSSVMAKLDNVQAGNIRIETAQAVSAIQYLELKTTQQQLRASVDKIPAIEFQVNRNKEDILDLKKGSK